MLKDSYDELINFYSTVNEDNKFEYIYKMRDLIEYLVKSSLSNKRVKRSMNTLFLLDEDIMIGIDYRNGLYNIDLRISQPIIPGDFDYFSIVGSAEKLNQVERLLEKAFHWGSSSIPKTMRDFVESSTSIISNRNHFELDLDSHQLFHDIEKFYLDRLDYENESIYLPSPSKRMLELIRYLKNQQWPLSYKIDIDKHHRLIFTSSRKPKKKLIMHMKGIYSATIFPVPERFSPWRNAFAEIYNKSISESINILDIAQMIVFQV